MLLKSIFKKISYKFTPFMTFINLKGLMPKIYFSTFPLAVPYTSKFTFKILLVLHLKKETNLVKGIKTPLKTSYKDSENIIAGVGPVNFQ